MRKLLTNKWIIRFAAVNLSAVVIPMNVWAAGPPQPSDLDNPLAVTLLIVIVALALAIALLGFVVIGAAQLRLERYKKDKASAVAKPVAVLAFCLFSTAVFAQDANTAAPQVVSDTISGLAKTSFYALVAVIGLELVILLSLLWFLRSLIAKEYHASAISLDAVVATKQNSWKKWWLKINSFRSMNEEQVIDLGHDYDNIRELDNKLPPWWIYGFYITIIFAGIYLWRYHVSHTAPLSIQEYEMAVAQAEEEKANDLKKAGGGEVDENTVKMLTAAADIESGKKIFTGTCAPCHGADGGGIVGPNLTDDYWIHGGRINDVFKTIKYGVPEKGMQPWKGTFSAAQIAQLASFIKSIHGTKVANPKEPQGDVFKEDSKTVSDTTRIAAVVK
jgi:cytochrome c oxidase cbb3-type subunit 3